MSTGARPFDRGEPVGFKDVPGFVGLLDADMNEVVQRQECKYEWSLHPGGATYKVTSTHEFDILGKKITYLAVGHDDRLLFVSIVAGHPVEHSARFSIRG